MTTTQTTRFDELKAANQLPSPTGVALAILRLTESETTTAQEIAHVLEIDPALTGRILKIANCAYFGRARAIGSVREAVTHLGVRLVRNVSLGFSLVSKNGSGACQGFDYRRFWSHSLAMAVAAQAAAYYTGKIVPAEAFTFGLLAQVGRLALASIYPDAYAEILTRIDANRRVELCSLEQEQFATDHTALTAALLKDWGLPDVCVEAVQCSEAPGRPDCPEGGPTQSLVRLLRLAADLADVCVTGGEGRDTGVLDIFAAGQEIGIPPHELTKLFDSVVSEWQEWGRMLQVDTRAVPPFAELAERARACSAGPADGAEVPADGPNANALSIVVVDDDAVQLRLLTRYLTKAGHQVRTARDGNEALRLALESNPQLVITDLFMAGMDGAALVKALRQTKLGRALYVIMLTSSDDDEHQVAAFEAGADDFVVKPFRPRLLEARLRACVRVVRLQGEVCRDRDELRRCMSELGVANRKLQQAALTDALTGLYNRRYALERLDQEWADATRSGQPLACMVLDLDFFKRVNDTYGHDVGDQVLRETAGVLRAALRQGDVVCRLGGEEFVVIGRGMNRQAAQACAERLRAGVAAQGIESANGALRVTISVGVAVRTADTAGPPALLKAADEAVYDAKRRGRNQVCLAATAEAIDVALTLSARPRI